MLILTQQTSFIGFTAKEILVTCKNIVTKPNLEEFLGLAF